MNKKLFLHIGPHKTGTTYLQKILHDNFDCLLASGLHYPKKFINIMYGQHQLVEKILTQPVEKLKEEIKLFPDMNHVISSENFDRLSVDGIKKVKDLFFNYDIQIIIYRRNYQNVLYSSWQEDVKHGGIKTFYEYAFSHLIKPYQSQIINLGALVKSYASVFGISNITMIDYDFHANGCGIIKPFLKIIDMENSNISIHNQMINKSLDIVDVEIIRGLNMLGAVDRIRKSSSIRDRYLRHLSDGPVIEFKSDLQRIIKNEIQSININSGHLDAIFYSKLENLLTIGDSHHNEIGKHLNIVNSPWIYQSNALEKLRCLYDYIKSQNSILL